MHIQLTAAGQRKITLTLVVIVACLITASTLGQASKYLLGYPNVKGLVPLFYVDNEANVPAWYSSLALALAALVLALITVVERWRRAEFRHHWGVLAALFLLLSLDEIVGLHELPIEGLRTVWPTDGALYYAWVVPGASCALLIGIGFARLLFHLPVATRKGMLVAAGVFLGGAIGVEMLSGMQASRFGEQNFGYALIITLEETLEMLGIVIFIHTLMSHLRTLVGAVHLELAAPPAAATSPASVQLSRAATTHAGACESMSAI